MQLSQVLGQQNKKIDIMMFHNIVNNGSFKKAVKLCTFKIQFNLTNLDQKVKVDKKKPQIIQYP